MVGGSIVMRLGHFFFAFTAFSGRYIPFMLKHGALPLIRSLRDPTFQQDNVRPNVDDIIRIYHEIENKRLLLCPARS